MVISVILLPSLSERAFILVHWKGDSAGVMMIRPWLWVVLVFQLIDNYELKNQRQQGLCDITTLLRFISSESLDLQL